ncbi:MAG: diacylglycerol/lipid kinase family protein [Phycisphaerales bacterium]
MRRVLVIFNPISGGGKAAAASVGVERELERAGFEVRRLATEPGPSEQWLDEPLAGRDALVVMGGDGAVRTAAMSAARVGVPLCNLPFGTENLFARHFGMTRDTGALVRRLRGGAVRRVDLALANGEPFLAMCGIGLDAEVVHDLAGARTGAISKLSYAKPILRQVLRWRAPRLRVELDGSPWSLPGPGFLVIGNSPRYAAHIDPAAMAIDDDGMLDACFFPCRSAIGAAGWVLRCWIRRQSGARRFQHWRAHSIVVRGVDEPVHYQMDGDRPRQPHDAVAVRIEVRRQALPVLIGSEK